jgi:adenosyl cobinamide kinase/adenosyl cobinamide phosphate guanylyltransferase
MITLVLGGARSGKSEVAERWAASSPEPVTYVATAVLADDDADFAARVDAHRARRPAAWQTVEPGEGLIWTLASTEGTVLLESLGAWVAAASGFTVDADGLCAVLRDRTGDTLVVSEEVGLGVHPSSEAGRQFRDALGAVNQAVAAVADRTVLVVAGRVLDLGVV